MRLFNTLSRTVEDFAPLHPPAVTYYTCGPTVYNFPHIGNLRTYINEDILRRALEWSGWTVDHVMNITDVGHLTSDADTGEDKIEQGAKRENKSVEEIIEKFTKAFLSNLNELNILRPQRFIRATQTIPEQIDLIKILEAKGFTYRTSDGIYFDSSKFPRYGQLAKLNVTGLKEGARIQKNAEKKHATDFAVWKFSPLNAKRQQEWDSPWGVGFPGWHLECSAIAMTAFGPTLDIHAGAIDHIPVHHTNEIAQSEAATDKPFVQTWFHPEFLLINGGRMGKSKGNFITLKAIKEEGIHPLAYRLFCFSAHYRSKLNFTWAALVATNVQYNKLQQRMRNLSAHGEPETPWVRRFEDAVLNDLDLPNALVIFWELLKARIDEGRKGATLLRFDEVLGLGLKEEMNKTISIPPEVQTLLAKREQSRAAKEFQNADDLRAQIETKGFIIEDTPQGPQLKRKS